MSSLLADAVLYGDLDQRYLTQRRSQHELILEARALYRKQCKQVDSIRQWRNTPLQFSSAESILLSKSELPMWARRYGITVEQIRAAKPPTWDWAFERDISKLSQAMLFFDKLQKLLYPPGTRVHFKSANPELSYQGYTPKSGREGTLVRFHSSNPVVNWPWRKEAVLDNRHGYTMLAPEETLPQYPTLNTIYEQLLAASR